ncbi:FhaA domain-containing protein [Streptomyces sp. NPDC058664]|uniref:FhaA domain-containing protein n=1 Tax=unclassified Streptomyces TaxID=2593676 RepID=UPI003669BA60
MTGRPGGGRPAGKGLSRWERALERRQKSLLSRLRHREDREDVELVDALYHECDEHAVVCGGGRVVVPNAFEVELDARVHEELVRHGRGDVGEALTDALVRHGERKGYEWAGPLTVRVTPVARPPGDPYRVGSSPMPHVRADAFPKGG